MPEPGHKKTVLRVLESLRGLDDLKQLFWTELNYERENTPLSDRGWPDAARDALAEAPLLLANGGTSGDFHVIYNRLKSEDLPRNQERQVVNQLLKEHPYALLVFSNEPQTRWHFLNVKYDDDIKKRLLFRRITVLPAPLVDRVDQILATRRADTHADISSLEEEINELVNQLYGLTRISAESGRVE